MSEKDPQVLVRMPSELKADLLRRAELNGRSLTSEINTRLRETLKREVKETAGAVAHALEDGPPSYIAVAMAKNLANGVQPIQDDQPSKTALEDKLVRTFRRMPFEKQLALLSLLN